MDPAVELVADNPGIGQAQLDQVEVAIQGYGAVYAAPEVGFFGVWVNAEGDELLPVCQYLYRLQHGLAFGVEGGVGVHPLAGLHFRECLGGFEHHEGLWWPTDADWREPEILLDVGDHEFGGLLVQGVNVHRWVVGRVYPNPVSRLGLRPLPDHLSVRPHIPPVFECWRFSGAPVLCVERDDWDNGVPAAYQLAAVVLYPVCHSSSLWRLVKRC